jgi:hypothetical protein
MPRDYSKADCELAQRLGVQPRQVERWRSEGCLQPPEWMHQPGMPGSQSEYPPGAAEQAARVRDLLPGKPRLIGGPRTSFDEVRIVLFWEDADDTVSAEDLAFVNLARARKLMNEAEYAELEQARELIKIVMAYAQTLAFIGSRTDRSLRWPAFTLVHKKVIDSAGAMVPLCLPFAVAARRQYGPGWDDHIARLARQAEAVASLLRALPRKLHRLVRADGTPARYTSGQLKAFQATYSCWAEQHPDLALLLSRSTDDAQAP